MSNEHVEYDRDVNPYPSFGKKYNGEKAIISLTSWKARINTVAKTLYSLIKQCPGFHIVLVLSEEEFPTKENELPEALLLFVENHLIELLWVHKNYKSFKKVLFTMNKYHHVPIISADDDCLYLYNYAEELYQVWKTNQSCFVTYYTTEWMGKYITGGYATLYPPYVFKEFTNVLVNDDIVDGILACHEDDCLYACLREKVHSSSIISLNKPLVSVAISHDECFPLHDLYQGDLWKRHLEQIWDIISPL